MKIILRIILLVCLPLLLIITFIYIIKKGFEVLNKMTER